MTPPPAPRLLARLVLAALVLVLAVAPAPAQGPSTPAAAAAPAVTPEQASDLIATLEDDGARARLIEQLQALVAAQEAAEPSAADEMSRMLLGYLGDRVAMVGSQLAGLARALGDIPAAFAMLGRALADPAVRAEWADIIIGALGVLFAGLLAFLAVRRLLRRFRRSAAADGRHELGTRALALLVQMLADLAPLAAFALACLIALAFIVNRPDVALVVGALVEAIVGAGVLVIIVRTAFTPRDPALRLFPMDDETASYLYVWILRVGLTIIAGLLIADVTTHLGVPARIARGFLLLVGLAVAAMLVVFILQNRRPVAEAIRGRAHSLLARRIADVWHVLAILYVGLDFVVWALAIDNGFTYVVRATLLTILIVAVARALTFAAGAGLSRSLAINRDLRQRYPGLEARANRYLPLLERTIGAIVTVIAAMAILEAWGIGGFTWLETEIGRNILSSAVSIALVLAVALIAWEVVSSLIERYLTQAGSDGMPLEHSARTRTLLPLLRNAFLIVLVTVVTFIVLSEVGINIAPLLAGAGVVGLAIGFGSQTLVKDIITGLFILFEDTIAVGDVVEAGGHSGLVESISIRTIRMRDEAGGIHTVPFSAVTSVLNMSRDFSFFVFTIRLALAEDTDRVVAVIAELGAELQADPEQGPAIIAPIEIYGVEAFADRAVVVKGRIKTRTSRQAPVGREFNRRLKKRFQELAIEMATQEAMLYFGDRKGTALPLWMEAAGAGPGRRGKGAAGRQSAEEPGGEPTAASRGDAAD